MTNVGLIIWIGIQIFFQLLIFRSIVRYLSKTEEYGVDDIDKHTYNLFVKGGWNNFQSWLAYYAENIWEDIILLSFVFILPVGIFDNISGKDKLKFIFTKIGIGTVFFFFVLGPPIYHITGEQITLDSYLSGVLKFDGDPNKEGYLSYFSKNQKKISQMVVAILLLIYILFRGKRIGIKYKETK
tara:strand:+ start:1419 stop:1970 length:552 start_codon:yes stop_codon:yes gene_type:complete